MKDRVGWGKGWVGEKKVIASLRSLRIMAKCSNDFNEAMTKISLPNLH